MIDAHAHLSSESDVGSILDRASQAGVVAVVNVCTTAAELERGLRLSEECTVPKIYTVASTTPHDASRESPEFFNLIEANADRLSAIGETGLDYYYEHSPKKAQQALFQTYIDLAVRLKKPLVIHCRDAFDDLFAILDEQRTVPPIMLHCFTGSMSEAKKAQDRGFYLSMSGIVTYPKSTLLQEVAAQIPSELLLVETDSPYLAPQSRRGKKNEPAYLKETVTFLAALRKVSVDDLVRETSMNAKKLFVL